MTMGADAAIGGRPETFVLTEEEVARLWRPDGIELTPIQMNLLPDIRQWLTRRRQSPLADYLVGKPVETLSPTLARELTADTLARFRPPSQGVEAASLLVKVIDRGNAEGIFVLCPPPVPVLIKRQPSPFHEDRWPLLEVASHLRSLLAQSICQPASPGGNGTESKKLARIELGKLLLSAVVHGGLLNPSALAALLNRLDTDTPLSCLGDRVFAELSLDYRNQACGEFRRWFPDPLSAILILALPRNTVCNATEAKKMLTNDWKRFIWQCISAFLKSVDAYQSSPNTLKLLFDAVRLDLESRIPIYLVNYASRAFVSHSLKPSTYRRLHGVPLNLNHDEDKPGKHAAPPDRPGVGIPGDADVSSDMEPRWLHHLRGAMKGNDRSQIIHRLNVLMTTPAPGFQRGEAGEIFAGCALRMFTVSNDNKVKMAVSTARAVVSSVSIRLGGLAGHDVSDFGTEQWGDLYQEALSDAETPGVRRRLARALRDFQRYLEQDRGAEPIADGELFAAANGLVPVDANLISEVEFLEIRARFTEAAADELPGLATRQGGDRLAEIAWLILTLAYRCGLRRMEVLKLEINDLMLDGRPDLLVRPSEARTLKTKSSTRKLPLDALLSTEELDRLRRWRDLRRQDEAKNAYSRFLFSIPGRGFTFVPQDTLFKLLHSVMREVTGDPTLRFHNLRHSFASRTYVMLAASAGGCAANVLATLPGYAQPLKLADELASNLFGHHQVTRRHVWAVCSLLGHSAPDISAEHYIHHLDIILAESLSCDPIAPTTHTVIEASRASQAQGYRHRSGSRLDGWVAHLFHRKFPAAKVTANRMPVKAIPGSAPIAKTSNDASESLLRIWRLLLIHRTRDRTNEELSDRYGIEAARLERYASTAIWLSDLRMSAKTGAYRHRFMEWTPDRRHPEQRRRIACPIKPHENRDRAVIVRLAEQIRDKFGPNRELIQRVVGHYVEGARPDCSGMIFTSPEQPEQALEFLRFLELLGCEKNEVEFISFDVTSARSSRTAAWRRALGLKSSTPISKAAPPNGRRDWACPWLEIRPVFPDNNGKKMGSAGFRFVMVMTAVAIGK